MYLVIIFKLCTSGDTLLHTKDKLTSLLAVKIILPKVLNNLIENLFKYNKIKAHNIIKLGLKLCY